MFLTVLPNFRLMFLIDMFLEKQNVYKAQFPKFIFWLGKNKHHFTTFKMLKIEFKFHKQRKGNPFQQAISLEVKKILGKFRPQCREKSRQLGHRQKSAFPVTITCKPFNLLLPLACRTLMCLNSTNLPLFHGHALLIFRVP